MDVLVAGGSGFIGRSLCSALDERGHAVTAASRTPDVAGLPTSVETVAVDITQPDLAGVVDGHDAVVNLVALPSHTQPRGSSHEAVHLDGTRHLVRASEKTDVDRFVQMSALGVDSGVPAASLEAKREAEHYVRESDLRWVVYRPSVVFGDGCAFVPFIKQVIPPVVAPLPSGGTMRIQPLWVEDLTPMLADGVEDARHAGQIYRIGGPEKLTFAETVTLVCNSRAVVPIPMPLAAVAFWAADHIPLVPFGLDQYHLFKLDNTTVENDVSAFGVSEDDLKALGVYLAGEQ